MKRFALLCVVAACGFGLLGCSSGNEPLERSSAAAAHTGSPTAVDRPLAFGTFSPQGGISGDVFVEAMGADIVVRLASFHTEEAGVRLVLTDGDSLEVGGCISADAAVASVGGSPAGPTSTFAVAKRDDYERGALPRFIAGVLVRQHSAGDSADCAEPIAAIAPLSWSD